ncbi:MAG: hypothetical protein ACYC19_00185 [Acidimicrobiales bacterium]
MNYGLAPRPELGPDETAAVIAAVEELLRARVVDAVSDDTPAWRFSGRWFHAGPLAMRRPHGIN